MWCFLPIMMILLVLLTTSAVVDSGDIIVCKIGDVIPADGRIIPGYLSSLEVDEALLTGESLPSVKQEEIIEDPDCPVGECVISFVRGALHVICA